MTITELDIFWLTNQLIKGKHFTFGGQSKKFTHSKVFLPIAQQDDAVPESLENSKEYFLKNTPEVWKSPPSTFQEFGHFLLWRKWSSNWPRRLRTGKTLLRASSENFERFQEFRLAFLKSLESYVNDCV